MRYFTLVKANIRRQKGSFIGILLLIFIITVSLCAVLTIWNNAHAYEEEQIDRIGYGDITVWIYDNGDLEGMTEQIRSVDAVEKVERQQAVMVNYRVNGHDGGGNGIITAYGSEGYDYYIYNKSLTGKEEEPEDLKEGEVYVSPAFCSLYDAEIGDSFEVEITGEQDVACYTIRGFFEDPMAGSAMMGMKTILMNETDMQRLMDRLEAAGEQAIGGAASMLHIYQKADSTLQSGEFRGLLNDKTDISASTFAYQKSAITGFMLLLQDVFSGFLLVFVGVLLVVAMIVIGYGISSSIEQDYVDMGILKALGFTKRDLKISQSAQYLAVVLAGMLLGVPVSAAAVGVINKMTVTATGLMIPETLPVTYCIAALGTILLLLTGFIGVQTGKIGKITPIRAIRGGAEDVYFKSRFTAPIYKGGIGFWLALRQLVSGKKQYISACIVTALLVFFLSLSGRIGAWMGEDGKGIMDAFGTAPYDLGVRCQNEEIQQEINDLIASRAGIAGEYEILMDRAVLNGMDYIMNVISEPDHYNILEGRTCRFANEVVVTEMVAEEIGAGIGDTVEVAYQDRKEEFLISGIYQSANDMGANFGVSKEAYVRLAGSSEEQRFFTCYQFRDSSSKKEIADLLRDTYGDSIRLDENTWSGVDSLVLAMDALGLLMYVVTVVFILVVVAMTGGKILYREQRDLGIYKSLGFASGRLRTAFALRFAIVAVAGSVLGIALSAWLTDPIVAVFLRFCGISRFASELSLYQMISPGIIVTLLFFIFAYLAAGKIKKVEPGILIVE